MKNIISRLLWLLKQKNNLTSISQHLKAGDNPELTKFLKGNHHFVRVAKTFH